MNAEQLNFDHAWDEIQSSVQACCKKKKCCKKYERKGKFCGKCPKR